MQILIRILIILYPINFVVYGLFTLKKDFISPNIIFLSTQVVMLFGIATIADFTRKTDQVLIISYFIAQFFFIFGTETMRKIKKVDNHKKTIVLEDKLYTFQKERIWLLIFVSLVASSYLFYSSGVNLFILSIKSFVTGQMSNYTESRLSFYGVRGVGYIYQFRVIILPILISYMITTQRGISKTISIMISPLMIVFLLGTGQRAGFVIFILIWVMSLLLIEKLYRNKFNTSSKYKTQIIIVSITFVILFSLMTLSNGRVTADNKNVFGAIIDRLVNDNQLTALVGFRYIFEQPTQWGMDWLNAGLDILPGKSSYLHISSRIFEIMYGSTRGTAPPCIWSSAYYNFGVLGIIVFPFLLGMFYRYIYYRLYLYPITKLRVFLYISMFITLGVWIADSPIGLFNQGFITTIIMSKVLHIDRSVKKRIKEQIL